MNIAVLLTCHNRREKTLCCLHNLFSCALYKDYELFVYLVDDGSTDGTANGVRENFPNVKIIQGDGNLFWNRGMNLAWKTAVKEHDYDFYLWLNDDTNLYSNALTELLETSKAKNNEAIICGSVCATNNRRNITYGGIKSFTHGLFRFEPNGEIQECECFNGNIVLIPKYVFEKVGFNNIYFRHSLGDMDYGLQAKKINIKSFVSANVLGECDRHDSLQVWDNQKYSLRLRWKSLHSPLGLNPREMFYFNKLHLGLLFAVRRYISIYARVLFPTLWKKVKRGFNE